MSSHFWPFKVCVRQVLCAVIVWWLCVPKILSHGYLFPVVFNSIYNMNQKQKWE